MTITLIMCGGLGNQLFRYAAARALGCRLGVPVSIDLRFYAGEKRGSPKYCWLEEFPISAGLITYSSPQDAHGLHRRVIRKFTERGRFRQNTPGFDPGFQSVGAPAKILGLFQSHLYFRDYYKDFAAELDLGNDPRIVQNERIRSLDLPNAAGIHVRRGDFVDLRMVLPNWQAYYAAAVQDARKGSEKVVIFSDDIDWCRHQECFLGCDFYPARENEPPYVDLFAMSFCKRLFIANSTFSWWAGWFAQSRGAEITMPETWSPGWKTEDLDLVPDGWRLLPN